MKLKARVFVWAFAAAVLLLPALSVQAVPWCDVTCNVWPPPCCSRPCWTNYWTTCGEEGFLCNDTCRSEEPIEARSGEVVTARDAALLRALTSDGCTVAPAAAAPRPASAS